MMIGLSFVSFAIGNAFGGEFACGGSMMKLDLLGGTTKSWFRYKMMRLRDNISMVFRRILLFWLKNIKLSIFRFSFVYKSNFGSFSLSDHIQHRSYSWYRNSTLAFSFLKQWFCCFLLIRALGKRKQRAHSWRHEGFPCRTWNHWHVPIYAVQVPVEERACNASYQPT